MGSNPVIHPNMEYSQAGKAMVFDAIIKGSNPFTPDITLMPVA